MKEGQKSAIDRSTGDDLGLLGNKAAAAAAPSGITNITITLLARAQRMASSRANGRAAAAGPQTVPTGDSEPPAHDVVDRPTHGIDWASIECINRPPVSGGVAACAIFLAADSNSKSSRPPPLSLPFGRASEEADEARRLDAIGRTTAWLGSSRV